ncbi:unnamed protein product, partial [Parnassius mnemosyne]
MQNALLLNNTFILAFYHIIIAFYYKTNINFSGLFIYHFYLQVDKYQSPDSDESDKTSFQNNTCTMITISKLNPDVPDFVPKSKSTVNVNVETHANQIDELNSN